VVPSVVCSVLELGRGHDGPSREIDAGREGECNKLPATIPDPVPQPGSAQQAAGVVLPASITPDARVTRPVTHE
jgi:hypothetical protein